MLLVIGRPKIARMEKKFIIDYFGNINKTAQALGIKAPSVHEWPEQLPFSAIGRIAILQPKAFNAWKRQKKSTN